MGGAGKEKNVDAHLLKDSKDEGQFPPEKSHVESGVLIGTGTSAHRIPKGAHTQKGGSLKFVGKRRRRRGRNGSQRSTPKRFLRMSCGVTSSTDPEAPRRRRRENPAKQRSGRRRRKARSIMSGKASSNHRKKGRRNGGYL